MSLREIAINTVQRTLDVYPAIALQFTGSSSDGSEQLLIRVTAGTDAATDFVGCGISIFFQGHIAKNSVQRIFIKLLLFFQFSHPEFQITKGSLYIRYC